MTRKAIFLQALEDGIRSYPWASANPADAAETFYCKIIKGEALISGTAVKSACKAAGIKNTYKAIKELE